MINHLQDCGKDFKALDRVYLPDDALARAGVPVEALGAAQASPALRGVIRDLATRTLTLLDNGAVLPQRVRDFRLSLENGRHHHAGPSPDLDAAEPRSAEPEGASEQGGLSSASP